MSQPVISIEALSKKYRISHNVQSAYDTLIDTVSNKARSWSKTITRWAKGDFTTESTQNTEDFWALKDVYIDIHEGDRLGIIGRNGAGKSTLLKLISRITYPTSGRIKIHGRVSSLLEVGTGFHLELSGRENIYLNGSILGMKRSEIQRKFDAIVTFSEVEQFLDTPVKRFSSGMQTRLGFAIAAHMDPDILIIDEVLAVGDAKFQDKCLKKLNELGTNGRTVIFVSHDVGSVLSLCNKGLYLNQGRVINHGPIDDCVNSYMKDLRPTGLNWSGHFGDEHIIFHNIQCIIDKQNSEYFLQGEPLRIVIDYEVKKPCDDLYVGFYLCNTRNQILAKSYSHDLVQESEYFKKIGKHQIEFTLDTGSLYEGDYLLRFRSGIPYCKDIVTDQIMLKLPIYQEQKNTRISHLRTSGEIYLGDNWKYLGQKS